MTTPAPESVNLLSQCSPWPLVVHGDLVTTFGGEVCVCRRPEPNHTQGYTAWPANAQLLAHAYDAALFAAAVWQQDAKVTMDGELGVWDGNDWIWFKLGTTPFGAPDLTHLSRKALKRAIGVEQ